MKVSEKYNELYWQIIIWYVHMVYISGILMFTFFENDKILGGNVLDYVSILYK